jgi:Tol biopolymer transport system component
VARQLAPLVPQGRYASFDLSPDETRILVIRRDERTDSRSIWLVDSRTGVSTQVVGEGPGFVSDPIWAPDGRRLAFRLNRSAVIRPVFGGEETKLVDRVAYPEDWSPDGRYVLAGMTVEGTYTLFAIDVADRTSIAAAPGQAADEGQFSPDGGWVAYHGDVRGRPEVFVTPFPPTGERRQISPNGGMQPQWCGSGRELLYLSTDGHVMSVEISPATGSAASPPRPIFEGRLQPSATYDQIRVTRNCDRILLQRPMGSDSNRLQIIVNWPDLISSRAGTS